MTVPYKRILPYSRYALWQGHLSFQRVWYCRGFLHRVGGPAWELGERKAWYLDGVKIKEELSSALAEFLAESTQEE